MNDESYSIGDVLYIISLSKEKKSPIVVPVQVVERLTRENLVDGIVETKISYFVKDVSKTVVEITFPKESVYRTPDQARNYLLKQAEKNIDNIVLKAVSAAEKLTFIKDEKINEATDEQELATTPRLLQEEKLENNHRVQN